jgi:uncharacterized protein (DUF2252 family)
MFAATRSNSDSAER